MTRKSPQQPNSIPGQRPALDPDADTVAIPRMDDEFTGNSAFEQQSDGGKRKHKP